MVLSLNAILFGLGRYSPERSPRLNAERLVSGMEFYSSEKELSEKIIYLADDKNIDAAAKESEDMIFVSVKNYTSKCSSLPENFIVFAGTDDLTEIFEGYTRLVNDLSSWENRLYNAVLRGLSTDELAGLAAEKLNFPVVMFDAGFNVSGYSVPDGTQIHEHENVIALGYAPPEYMTVERERNMESRILGSDRALTGKSINGDGYNIYRAHKADGRFAGLTMIFCGSEKPHPGFTDICEIFFAAADLYLKLTSRDFQTLAYLFENLFTNLLQTENYPEEKLKDHLEYINFPSDGIFTLVKLVPGKGREYYVYICSLLRKYFPGLYFFVYEEKVCLLYRAENPGGIYPHKSRLKKIIEKIDSQIGSTYSVKYLISGPFENLSGLVYAGRQCDILTQIKNPKEEAGLIFFEDNLNAAAAGYLKEHFLPVNLLPSDLVQMLRYDEENDTHYTETLAAYTECSLSMPRAAEKLGVHRNTVDKRLKKIQTLFGIDTEDMDTLIKIYTAVR